MVSEHHDRDREEGDGRVLRQAERESDRATGQTGKGAKFHEHVLIQDAAPQGHVRHAHDVTADAKRDDQREEAGDPRHRRTERPLELEIIDGRSKRGEQRGASDRGPRAVPAQHDEPERH